MYRADGCPVDKEHIAQWSYCLEQLALQFDTKLVHVDKCVSNAGRIARLPFSMNRKGDNTAERPHRRAHVVSYPEQWVAVDNAEVSKLATEMGFDPSSVKERKSGSCNLTDADMETFLEDCEEIDFPITVCEVEKRGSDTYYHLEECPLAGYAHPGGPHKTSLILGPHSRGFKCFADQCDGLGFVDLLDLIEEETGTRPNFGRITEAECFKWGMTLDDLAWDPQPPERNMIATHCEVVLDEEDERPTCAPTSMPHTTTPTSISAPAIDLAVSRVFDRAYACTHQAITDPVQQDNFAGWAWKLNCDADTDAMKAWLGPAFAGAIEQEHAKNDTTTQLTCYQYLALPREPDTWPLTSEEFEAIAG